MQGEMTFPLLLHLTKDGSNVLFADSIVASHCKPDIASVSFGGAGTCFKVLDISPFLIIGTSPLSAV